MVTPVGIGQSFNNLNRMLPTPLTIQKKGLLQRCAAPGNSIEDIGRKRWREADLDIDLVQSLRIGYEKLVFLSIDINLGSAVLGDCRTPKKDLIFATPPSAGD